MPRECPGVRSLRGEDVTFTGRVFVRDEWRVRAQCEHEARRHGATVAEKFRGGTTLVVRGDLASLAVEDPKAGLSRKLLAAAHERRARRHVHVIDGDGFADLLEGRNAVCLPLRRRGKRVEVPRYPGAGIFGGELVVAGAAEHDARELRLDLDALDRGTRAHQATVTALQRFVEHRGMPTKAPAASAPRFDAGWLADHTPWIAEVKSISAATEPQQIRLGLGQLLDYRGRLSAHGRRVRAALILSSEPRDGAWAGICDDVGVVLSWAPNFPRIAVK